jgi:hypothetical protein
MGLTTSSRKKKVVQKPNNQPRVETGCQGGQGSPRVAAPSEEEKEVCITLRLPFTALIREQHPSDTGNKTPSSAIPTVYLTVSHFLARYK